MASEKGYDESGNCIVASRYFRPANLDTLLGDAVAREKLGWEPRIKFDELVREGSGPKRCFERETFWKQINVPAYGVAKTDKIFVT